MTEVNLMEKALVISLFVYDNKSIMCYMGYGIYSSKATMFEIYIQSPRVVVLTWRVLRRRGTISRMGLT